MRCSKVDLNRVNELLTHAVMLTLAYSSICTICDNADRILNHELKCLCSKTTTVLGMNQTKNYACEALTFLLHYK
jgi:hypothetical protein